MRFLVDGFTVLRCYGFGASSGSPLHDFQRSSERRIPRRPPARNRGRKMPRRSRRTGQTLTGSRWIPFLGALLLMAPVVGPVRCRTGVVDPLVDPPSAARIRRGGPSDFSPAYAHEPLVCMIRESEVRECCHQIGRLRRSKMAPHSEEDLPKNWLRD